MAFLRVLLAAVFLAGAWLGAAAPASAQFPFFERHERPPPTYRAPQRRLPGTGDYDREYSRRQYVPEQRTRPRRRGFFERLFDFDRDEYERDERDERYERADPRNRDRPRPSGGEPETAAPVKKAVPKTIFVAVIGDSFAQDLAPGLSEALSERPEVGLVREIRPGIGFLKETEKTWRMVVDEVLARDPPITAAVIFMGPNDDPPKKKKKKKKGEEEAEVTPPTLTASPWMDRYAAKVDDIALAFRQKNIPMVWVGLPPVEDEKTTADHLFLNDLVRQRVVSLGGAFVDVWQGFVDEEEKFTVQGPNIEGRVVRLRTADGVHFTKAGARKIGHAVELELRAYLQPKEQGDSIADLGFDPGAPTTPGSSRILLLGQIPRTPGAILVPSLNKPAEPAATPDTGETADASAAGTTEGEKKEGEKETAAYDPGVMTPEDAPAEPAPPPEPAAPPVPEGVLVTGEAVPPKPGRADDFSWPQDAAAN